MKCVFFSSIFLEGNFARFPYIVHNYGKQKLEKKMLKKELEKIVKNKIWKKMI